MPPKDIRPIDRTDRRLIAELVRDARVPNATLASRAGVAASTALERVRALRRRGVIRSFTAELSPTELGFPVQAIVALRLRSHDAAAVRDLSRVISAHPAVLQCFHVSGADDFLVHIAAESPEALRDLILASFTAHPTVAQAQTHLVFSRERGAFMSTP